MPQSDHIGTGSILTVVFTVSLATGAISPLLPAIQAEFGLSATALSLILATFGITRLAIDVPAGRLLRSYGALLLLTVGALSAAAGALGAVVAPSYEWLLASRVLVGIGSAITVVISLSTLARQSSRPDSAMSHFYIAMFTAMILGPVVAGLLEGAWSWRAPMAVVGLLTFVAAIWIARKLERPDFRRRRVESRSADDVIPLRRSRPVLTIYGLSFVALALYSGAKLALLPLLGANDLGLSVPQIGLIFTATAILTPVTMLATARVASPHIKSVLIGGGLVVWVVGLGLLLVPNVATFIAASACFDLAGGLMYATPYALLTDCVHRSAIGQAMGEVRLPADVAWLIVPPLIGIGLDVGGPGVALGGLLIMTVATLGAVSVFLSRDSLNAAVALNPHPTVADS